MERDLTGGDTDRADSHEVTGQSPRRGVSTSRPGHPQGTYSEAPARGVTSPAHPTAAPSGPALRGVAPKEPERRGNVTAPSEGQDPQCAVAGASPFPPLPGGTTTGKVTAAVVWMQREDGRILALTRGGDFADWHLPGGKWEPTDPGLESTAVRELAEETGVHIDRGALVFVGDYVTRSGRPVQLFRATAPAWCPETFPSYPAGQPAWVPPAMLTMPSCSFAYEAARVIDYIAEIE